MDIHNKLLKLIEMFHVESEKQELEYFIDFGTLLGAVRHSAIIAHDDDIDIMVFKKDEEKLIKVLNKLQCKFCRFHSGFKLFFEGDKIKKYEWSYPFVDICLVYKDNKNRITYSGGYWLSGYKKEIELYPKRIYTLNNLQVWGPAKPIQFLDRYYKDWDKKIVTHNWDHQNEKAIKKRTILLEEKDYRSKWL